MKKLFLFCTIAGFVLLACEGAPERARPGATYARIARPEVWKVLPYSQAESLAFQPGDLLLSYNREVLASNEDVRVSQGRVPAGQDLIPVVVLREGHEVEYEVRPGPLGGLPVAAKYPSSLALALEDIMRSLGLFTDYDWLAALTGESFALTASDDECRAWWPGGMAGAYLEDLALMAGLKLRRVYGVELDEDPVDIIRGELLQGRAVLVSGGWPESRAGFWGVATRFDQDENLAYGYSLDAAAELSLTGVVLEVYVVGPERGWDEPDEVLALVLNQALELGQTRIEYGWKSGLQAYDLLITSLDTMPFCPVCGMTESQSCFDRLLWAMIAHKESAIRFLGQVREAVPDQQAVLDEILGDQQAALAKLEGIMRSRIGLKTLDNQRKIARTLGEVQIIENDLLGLYEELLAAL